MVGEMEKHSISKIYQATYSSLGNSCQFDVLSDSVTRLDTELLT